MRRSCDLFIKLIFSRANACSGGFEHLRHIHENATVVLKQLAFSPQCGFASTEEENVLTEEEQWQKMHHVVDLANRVWH